MGIFLVMKNNLKRYCNTKITIILVLVLPFVAVWFGGFMDSVGNDSVVVGIEGDLLNQDEISQLKNRNIEVAEGSYSKADLLMKNCDYIVKQKGKEAVYIVESLDREETKDSLIEWLYSIGNDTEMDINEVESSRMLVLVMAVFMILSTLHATLLIRDHKERTIRRFQYGVYSVSQYVLGNLLSNFLVLLVGVIASFIAMILLPSRSHLSYGVCFLMLVIEALFATAFGTFLCSLFGREERASQMCAAITIMCSVLGGGFVSVKNMPFILQRLSVISPMQWIVKVTEDCSKNLAYGILIGGMIVLLFSLATKIQKKKQIM